ncbi:hypothetical protein CTI12_AA006220 [Artemisia annua]|uniref:COI1 F-box domain-containing protein n=1 Tax=Artemisia annua TaxID=35608 RepID=A0A2U1QNI6_ARTAN|nr:hypothetical protein CTI12_AA006220 [Artemisia annua]
MENHPHESIDTFFNCVIPYIQNGDDRNSVSLVCREWYELDCMTRKLLTVHLIYSPTPSRLHQRFPSIDSLTLKGLPFWFKRKSSIEITPWVQEIFVSYKCLKVLHIRRVVIRDSDLKLLARTRGKDLQVLKIYRCEGFSTDGLLHIGKYCNDLKTLCLEGSSLNVKDGKWLHELALHNTSIESLTITFKFDVRDLTPLAKSSSQSLVSLKIRSCDLIDLVDVFSYAVRLEEFYGDGWNGRNKSLFFDREFVFNLPPPMRSLSMDHLTKTMFPFVLPFAHQLRELDFINVLLKDDSQSFFIQRSPNLEVLYAGYVFEDMGLQAISQFCKKLRKLKTCGFVSHTRLISLAQGCVDLECLHINLKDITKESMEFIGTHLKSLRDFQMKLSKVAEKITAPLDEGVRLMLIGCSKLERLGIYLCSGGLTDVGLGYIGRYGYNLRYLSPGYLGESDAGLVDLSKGCPKLRKLEIQSCPFSNQALATFVYDLHSLRYMWVCDKYGRFILAMTRPHLQP